jgi:hypothetical protein
VSGGRGEDHRQVNGHDHNLATTAGNALFVTLIAYFPAVTTPPDADDVQDTPEEPSAAAAWTPPGTGTAAPPSPEHAAAFAPPAPGPAPAPRRTNRFAIVALLSGIFGLVVFAIGFAIAAFVQAGRRGEKGKGLAAGGLAASAAWITAAVLVLATGVLESGIGDAPQSKGGKPRVTALLAGDCFTDLQDDRTSVYVTKTPCTRPHEGEIGAVVTLADAPYPGDATLLTEATKECRDKAGFLLKSRYSGHLELHIDRPRRAAWVKGHHDVICVLRYTGSEKLTSTLASALQGNLQWTTQLRPGDCIKKWSAADKQPLVECTEPHEYELFAVFTLQGNEYPGEKAIERKADEGCATRAKRLWHGKPPSSADPAFWGPTRDGWESQGSRLVYCMVTGRGGPLKKSVVPH